MAREVAIDVAAHSPQVDPDTRRPCRRTGGPPPDRTPRSRSTPRPCTTRATRPRAMPRTGWTICVTWCGSPLRCRRHWKTGTGSSQSWHRTRYSRTLSNRPRAALDMRVAALSSVRREQTLPHGLRDFLAHVHNAGAAVDFSVPFPGGRLVDAPLPTWTHRQLLLTRDSQDHPNTRYPCGFGASIAGVACAPARGARAPCVAGRSRHRGPPVARRSPDTQRGRPSGRGLLRDDARRRRHCPRPAVRGPRHPLRADALDRRRDPARCRRVAWMRPASPRSWWKPTTVANACGGRRRSCTPQRTTAAPPGRDIDVLLAGHPNRLEGAELRQWFDACGLQFGPAFTGLSVAHTAEGRESTVLAEIGLPGTIRSQQAAYGVHPGTPGCLLPGRRSPPRRPGCRRRRPAVAAGCGSAGLLRRGPQRPLLLHPARRESTLPRSRLISTSWTSTGRCC